MRFVNWLISLEHTSGAYFTAGSLLGTYVGIYTHKMSQIKHTR